MSKNNLPLLVGVTAAVLGLGFWLNQARAPKSDVLLNKPLVEGIAEQINNITGIKITGPENKVIADLNRGLKGWVVSNRADYPADFGKIREFVLKVSESKIKEAKTSNPELFGKLGLEDLAQKDAKGVRFEINGLKTPVNVLVGSFSSAGGEGHFVRRGDEQQSYLASGNFRPETNESAWLNAEVVNIGSPRIRRVDTTLADGKVLSIEKVDSTAADYSVLNIPKGRELSSPSVGNTIATTLDALRLDDVMKPEAAPAPAGGTYKSRFLTQEGLVITLEGYEIDGKSYAKFSAELDSTQSEIYLATEQVKAENEAKAKAQPVPQADAEGKTKAPESEPTPAFDAAKFRTDKLAELNKQVSEINERTSGWVYVIPSWKFANVKKTMDELLKAKA
jgi:hypothetical protein